MNGVHDMGGMHGFGPLEIEQDEPVFHHKWEGVVRAMMARTNGRYYNLDEFRHAVERMPAEDYLRASYYERWLHAVETLLREKGALGEHPPKAMAVRESPPNLKARFQPGDGVVTRNINPGGHTRLPRYARAKRGVVRKVYGPFLLPDANAHGDHNAWQPCYAVEFEARDLWGDEANSADRVSIDLWESYLE